MSDVSHIVYEKDGPVAWVTLNRPDVLNALNLAMRDDLWSVLLAIRDDVDVRAVVFRGAGERAFSAGADISEFGTAPSYIDARRARHERDVWGLMLAIPKPMVAAIHGYALGAGCELSLCCDIRLASEDARLGVPETNLGYICSAGGTQTLPRTVPPGLAAEMILTADPIDAERAYEAGLVHRVVPRERLYDEAAAIAHSLARLDPSVAAAAKRAVYESLDMPPAEAVHANGLLAAQLLGRSPLPAAFTGGHM
ncbi:MAG TPA: enoyl-CoA hydratase/isomerase family protein [Dehalococcoidia bacterium]|nr:enoyl-CoA hydratase/isomerase family protein [Dehalococcoidia bacterium]